jgi:hypothetical protein
MFKKIMEWLAGKPEGGVESPKMSETSTVVVTPPPAIVVTEVAPVQVEAKVSQDDLKGLDKKALIAKAKELNIQVNARMTKDEITKKLLKA